MKLSLSILLLAAIAISYYLVGSLVDRGTDVPISTLNFSGANSEIRQLGAFNAYESISRRPLFDVDREPERIEVKKKSIQKIPVKKDLLVIALGIAITGESILAVIKDMKNGKIIRLRINEEIYGWTLKGVSEERFVFSKGDTERAIKFKNIGYKRDSKL